MHFKASEPSDVQIMNDTVTEFAVCVCVLGEGDYSKATNGDLETLKVFMLCVKISVGKHETNHIYYLNFS